MWKIAVTLVMVCLTVAGAAACASTAGTASTDTAAAGGDERIGVVTSGGEVNNRLIRLRVVFENGTEETLDLREGQTVSYQQPDGTYRFTPRVSRDTVGKMEIAVVRDSGSAAAEVVPTLSVGEEMDLAHEFRELGWPYVSVKVVRVQPPIRRGPNPISDY